MRLLHTITLVPILLAVVGLSSCSTLYKGEPTPQWVQGEVQTRSEKVLYDATLISLRKAGYPVGMGANSGAREVASGFLNSESPFKGRGYRQKATVNYEPTGPDRYLVKVRVERQTNESFRPLDPAMADWQPAEDDPMHAGVVLQYIQSNVGVPPIDIGAPARPGQR